jgi:hypothetical protein
MFHPLRHNAFSSFLVISWMVWGRSSVPLVKGDDGSLGSSCVDNPQFICGAAGTNTTLVYRSCGNDKTTFTIAWESPESVVTIRTDNIPDGDVYNVTHVYTTPGTYLPQWQVDVEELISGGSLTGSVWNCKLPGDILYDSSCEVARFVIEYDSCFIDSPPFTDDNVPEEPVDSVDSSASFVFGASPMLWSAILTGLTVVSWLM